MIQNNKKKHGRHTIEQKARGKAMTRYEKLDLYVNGIGHFLTLGLVVVTFVELLNVKEQYKLNTEQYKLNTEQFKLSVDQFNSNYEQQKKANTISYLQSLHELVDNTDESLLEIIKYYDITNDSVSMISCDSLEKILKENHTYRKQLNDLYIGFNQLAIGCREGFFDEKIAWIANASMISRVTKALIPYYELIEKENILKCYGSFLRIMVFRWEHANPFIDEFNNKSDRFKREVKRATNDSVPYIRRMPVINE